MHTIIYGPQGSGKTTVAQALDGRIVPPNSTFEVTNDIGVMDIIYKRKLLRKYEGPFIFIIAVPPNRTLPIYDGCFFIETSKNSSSKSATIS